MRVTPISAKEADAQASSLGLWPPGEYDFTVYDASEEVSTANNDQIKLTLHVFTEDGRRRTVFDYLVGTEKAAWKLRHFAEATGTVPQYEAGELEPTEIVGREGRLMLRVKKGSNGYADQNSVGDYVKREGRSPAPPRQAITRPVASTRATAPAGDIDDDIPF